MISTCALSSKSAVNPNSAQKYNKTITETKFTKNNLQEPKKKIARTKFMKNKIGNQNRKFKKTGGPTPRHDTTDHPNPTISLSNLTQIWKTQT